MDQGDEDIKIYTADEDEAEQELAEGEEAAALFLFHKKQGNLARSRQLGELLARQLLEAAPALQTEEYGDKKLVLLSFIALDSLADGVRDPVLCHSAKAAFRRTVETRSPEVSRVITDSTAYTVFMLNDRLGGGRTDGQVLAELCDDDNVALTAEGDRLAGRYRAEFGEAIASADFVPYTG